MKNQNMIIWWLLRFYFHIYIYIVIYCSVSQKFALYFSHYIFLVFDAFHKLVLILPKTYFRLNMSTHKQKMFYIDWMFSRNCYAGRLIMSVFQEPYITMGSSKYVLHGKGQLPHCTLKVMPLFFDTPIKENIEK